MALTPAFLVVCSLLVLAGGTKVVRPAETHNVAVRLLGISEVAVGGWAALSPSALTGALVAAAYAAFCGFLLVRGREAASDCGCFGGAQASAGALHVALNCAACLVAALAALQPPPGILWVFARSPLVSATLIVGTAGAAFAAYLSYTVVPAAWRAYGPGDSR